MTIDERAIHDEVRAKYAAAAATAAAASGEVEAKEACCTPDGSIAFGELLYAADDRASLPDAAVLGDLGCGNPTAVAELREGERVLDLGRAAASTSSSPPVASARPAVRSAST